jgi:hypothetical protein
MFFVMETQCAFCEAENELIVCYYTDELQALKVQGTVVYTSVRVY